MGMPCEPLTPRQELISECEGLGLDAEAPTDWRDTYSDDELQAAIDRLDPQFPDISEMVAAIECAAKAIAASLKLMAMPPVDGGKSNEFVANACVLAARADKACRDILTQITKAQEA